MKRKIFFRADASQNIGYGHFIRTLALADMLKDDFDCVFYTQTPTEYQRKELEKVCPFIELPDDDTRFRLFIEELKGDEIVVLDNYFFTTDYQRSIKTKGCKLVCVDDMHDKHYVADVVINHALTDATLFDSEPYTKLCLGFNYALLRAPFLKPISHIKRGHDIVVNFGGADPFGITDSIVSMLLNMSIPYRIVVVLGDKVYLSEENRNKVVIRRNLSSEEMAELFEESAAGVLSASTVCIEALSRNLPLIAGYHVDNQKFFYQLLVENDAIQPIGHLQEVKREHLEIAVKNLQRREIPLIDSTSIKNNYQEVFKLL